MFKTIQSFIKDAKLQIQKFLNKKTDKDYPWYDLYENAPRSISYPRKTIYELIEQVAIDSPKSIAYTYFGKNKTFKQFNEEIIEVARGLRAIGIRKDDKVTICHTNTPDAIIFFYAVNMVGAVANMVHPLASVDETKLYLTKSGSRHVLCVDLAFEKFKKIDEDLNLKTIITSKVSSKMPGYMKVLYNLTKKKVKVQYSDKVISFEKLVRMGKSYPNDPKVRRRYNDDATILYSGGTTGEPKGVVLTNLNLNAMGLQAFHMTYPINKGDRALSTLPIFHSFGLIVSIHTVLINGLTSILVPGFTGKDFGKLIKKHKPHFIAGVPTMYEGLVNDKTKGKNYMKSVHTILCGGDLLNRTLRDKVDKYLADHGCEAKIRMGYGLTETSGACTLTPRNYFKDGGIGIPFPDMVFKILDIENNEELGFDQIGEICVSGPTVMDRYLNDIRETNKVLKRHKDGKLWLHTGDIGYMDKQGAIFFKSRLKRMIVSSGYNIYPQYLEKIIMEHPAIETATVVGVPHHYKQAVPKAFIVLKDDFEDTELLRKEIKKFCEEKINKYEWIYEYEYVNSLPETLMGKVAFTKLQEEENEKGA